MSKSDTDKTDETEKPDAEQPALKIRANAAQRALFQRAAECVGQAESTWARAILIKAAEREIAQSGARQSGITAHTRVTKKPKKKSG